MSYDITFDGSLVDNRNLPQLTVNSSLTELITNQSSESRFEFNGQTDTTFRTFDNGSLLGPSASQALASKSNFDSAGLGFTISNVNQTISISLGTGINALVSVTDTSLVLGGLKYIFILNTANGDISGKTVTITQKLDLAQIAPGDYGINLQGFDANGNSLYNLFSGILRSQPTSPFTESHTFNVPSSGATTFFMFGLYATRTSSLLQYNAGVRLDYSRYTIATPTPVTTTQSTIVEGVQKTGGVASTSSVTTTQDGSPAPTGPAKLFGLEVKDGTEVKASAKYLPSADSTTAAESDVCDVKVITADNTSLAVEATGLGGPENLEVDSSILVEDVTEQTEN